jgi:hypothetical protein
VALLVLSQTVDKADLQINVTQEFGAVLVVALLHTVTVTSEEELEEVTPAVVQVALVAVAVAEVLLQETAQLISLTLDTTATVFLAILVLALQGILRLRDYNYDL